MCLDCYDSLSPDAVSSYRHKDTMKKRRATGGFADRGESNPVFCTAQETRKSLSPPNLDEGREKYRGSSAGVKARRGVEHSDEARLPQSGNRAHKMLGHFMLVKHLLKEVRPKYYEVII